MKAAALDSLVNVLRKVFLYVIQPLKKLQSPLMLQ
jgi:hypothetical protein